MGELRFRDRVVQFVQGDEREGVVLLGEAGVDSGTLFLGDPCYLVPRENERWGKDNGNWESWCEKILVPEEQKPKYKGEAFDVIEPIGKGMGLWFGTTWGDGGYKVYGEVKNGRIRSVTVFMDEDPYEEDPNFHDADCGCSDCEEERYDEDLENVYDDQELELEFERDTDLENPWNERA